MTTSTVSTLLLSLLLPACLSEAPELIGETEQALATMQSLGTPAVTPIGGFEMRADRIVYVGKDGAGYRAYELDDELETMRQSPAIATTTVPQVENLTTDGTHVLFGDGARNMKLSLAGGAAQASDSMGVFGKSIRGNGGVTMRDGTLTRIMTSNGFGINSSAPQELFSGGQPAAAPVLSAGTQAYVVPAGHYLRAVDTATKTTKLLCKTAATYAPTKSLMTDHTQPKGNLRAAAKTLDGRLAECKGTMTSASVKLIDLPFDVGDLAFEGGGGLGFEGGGGLGFEGGGGLGIWVSSANTPELAYVAPTGKITVYPLSGKTSITPIPIPRVVRSFSDGSAAVLMSDGRFLRITRM